MTEPTTASAPADGKKPRAPRVPRKGVDAALRIAEATARPAEIKEFIAGNSDVRKALISRAAQAVENAEVVTATAKANLAELESMAHAIEGLGGFALSGVSAALAGRITK